MRNWRFQIGLAALLCITTLAIARDGGKPKPGRVEGTISATTATSITITDRQKHDITLTVDGSTKIERNEVRVKLGALQVGDRAEARFDSTTNLASKIEARGR